MIAGLEEISQGTVALDGEIINELDPKDRDIAMVFQNDALLPHLSVFDNLALGLKLRKFPKTQVEHLVREAAETLELTSYLERKPGALSGGERQRVSLGRAIVRKPKVFLFDEPLSSLDAPLREQMRRELAQLHRRLGVTTLYVTHDQSEAMALGDRIGVMKEGVLQQIARPMALYTSPVNLFVAKFIGSPPINLFHGVFLVRDNQLIFQEENQNNLGETGFQVRLPPDKAPGFEGLSGKKVILALRAEDVHLMTHTSCPKPGNNAISARVKFIEPLGWETLVRLKTPIHSFVCRTRSLPGVDLNQAVAVELDLDRAHFFDPITEALIR
jgi:multiple sugar transport system ATP-binding protein